MSGNQATNNLQSRRTVSQGGSSKPPTVAGVLRAWRKADKCKLAEYTEAIAGTRLKEIHVLLLVMFIDKGEHQNGEKDNGPDYVLNKFPYTYDVMGEWIDRQASTAKQLVKDLKTLQWIETTIDSKHYRGTTEVRVFAGRALKSITAVGQASIADIKDRRRCNSQKRKADTRKRADRRQIRKLPDSWTPLLQTVESWPGDRIEWFEAYYNLYGRGESEENVRALLMQHTTDPLDPHELLEAHTKWLAEKLKRHEKATNYIKATMSQSTVAALKTWDKD